MSLFSKNRHKPRTDRGLLRQVLLEWGILTAVLLFAIYALSGSRWMTWANHYAYDRLLPLHQRIADDRVVLVTIDEASIAELGRWPWPRKRHAELLDQLKNQNPKAILLDVIFTEPAPNQDDDIALGAAMAGQPISAPILMQGNEGQLQALPPIPSVAHHSSLGHIALLPDEDGVVRRVALSQADNTGRTWPLLTSQLLDQATRERAMAQGNQMQIPFSIRQGSFVSFSYRDVLAGRVPAGFLHDKYVLIGATAIGLGDQYPTPTSGYFSTMAGVEIHANILDALLNNLRIFTLNTPVLTLLPILVLLVGLLLVSERYHLLWLATVMLTYATLVCALLWWYGIWLPPISSLLGLFVAYVVWSWRRLAVILQHVRNELIDLREHTGRLSKLLPNNPQGTNFRPHKLELNIQHAQHLSHFVSESLQQLPVAMILVESSGLILMHNHLAQQDVDFPISNASMFDVFKQLDKNTEHWAQHIQHDFTQLQGREFHTRKGLTYALHIKPIDFKTSAPHTIWQISWIDLSNERAAQSQRNHLMAFLSHDLRAPQVGILALLDLFRSSKSQLTVEDTLQQISDKVHYTLEGANNLVQLARAQNGNNYQMNEVNLIEIIYVAVEQTWAQASNKQIQMTIDQNMNTMFDQTWLCADGALLTRAFVNVLTNAIRYSPSNTEISINIKLSADHGVTTQINDQGYGMSPEQTRQINLMMQQQNAQLRPTDPSSNPSDEAGSMNVGLHMVAAVIQQHAGKVHFESNLSRGTQVHIHLPTLNQTEQHE